MDIDDWYKWSKKGDKYKKMYFDHLGKLYRNDIKDNPDALEKTLDSFNHNPQGISIKSNIT